VKSFTLKLFVVGDSREDLHEKEDAATQRFVSDYSDASVWDEYEDEATTIDYSYAMVVSEPSRVEDDHRYAAEVTARIKDV
jgi:hypothetical protein